MTYEEFEREIKKLGLVIDYSYYFVSVYYYSAYSSHQLAYISREISNRMVTTLDISILPKNVGYKLLTLCYKLARTTLDERETVVLD